jgi:dTDP-4-amino-4,6-dideoxygalactose transaminase
MAEYIRILEKQHMIPFTNLHQQYLDCQVEIDQAIAKTINSSSFITGPNVTEFEQVFSKYVQAEDCASTGSGTTALLCSVRAMGIQPGDEVITTPHTFVATTEAIVVAGGVPVFVDIDPDTYLINVDKIESAITAKTKGILFVDLYGQCPNIDRIRAICTEHKLWMIEDAAQSLGNFWQGRPVGSLSDITCTSFNPVKNLGAMGDAGACSGNHDFMERVRMYRDHGRVDRYDIVEVGYNARIDNMQANIVSAKLPRLAQWVERKQQICTYYNDRLSSYIKTPKLEPGNTHSWYVYVLQTKQRSELQSFLKERGIATNIHYARPTHTQPAYQQWYSSCPVTEQACEEIVSIPCWYSLTDTQVDYIADSVKEWICG